jgi:ATP-binding cassette subfamily B protein RaxB
MMEAAALPSWNQRRALPLVLQTETAECGLACLAMIGCFHGHEVDLVSLRHRFSTSMQGVHLARLIEIADALGFESRPLRVELEDLPQAQLPCILHWDLNHFVVLKRVSRRGLDIHDPAHGRRFVPIKEAGKHFTGILLELTPGHDFTIVRERQHIPLQALTGRLVGLPKVLVQVLGLALAIELLTLILPFQMQWTLDQVMLSADRSLLLLMTFGFLAIVVLSAGLSIARAWIISWLGATLNTQWIGNLFSHLLKLPMDFFEKRQMGDLLSRFSSVHAIQNTLTGSFIEAVLDGVMGALALAVLFLYSAELTLLVLAAVMTYVAMRWIMYRKLWRLNEEQLVYWARQQSELMESVRGVQAIKLANKQSQRRARLANATLAANQREMQAQRITLIFGVLNRSVFSIQRVLLLSLGAYLALKGQFSVGMLVAYLAYADQFATKANSLIDKIVDFRMLRLHAERISDVALAAPEKHTQSSYSGPEPDARITVKGLGFRYSQGDPWLFRDLNLELRAGESVAVVGPSGYGKSTLAKLLVGLLEPSEGCIEIDGIDIRRFGLDNYRRLLGVVMQDDSLFAGSVAANIALFDDAAQMDAIVAAATLADIHRDVMAMPMGYESLIGDMGAALSGGQRQRLILARALYRQPRILVLDEATSHLDVKTEQTINRAVCGMRMTRIMFAHRPETIASADRVVDMEQLAGARNA